MRICLCQPVLNEYNPQIRAFFEVLTHGLSVFAKIAAIKHDIEFKELTYTAATPCHLEGVLAEADAFVFAGHSNRTGEILVGRERTTCIDPSNAHLLKGVKVYLICCHTANSLAQLAVAEGAEYCLAFDDKVYLMARKQEPVLSRCLAEGIMSIIRGDEPPRIFRSVVQKHKLWIEKILEKYADDEEWLLAACGLDWNMEHFNVVTKEGALKGESIMQKITNPCHLSDKQIEAAIKRLRRKVAEMEPLDTAPGLVTGGNESLSPAEILKILEKRKDNEDWGHDDIPERYLVQLAKTAR